MPVSDDGSPYGLRRPTIHDAREAIHRVHGADGPAVWAQLLVSAGVADSAGDESALPRVLTAMAQLGPVSKLSAQALGIRLSSYTHLSAAHTLTRSQP